MKENDKQSPHKKNVSKIYSAAILVMLTVFMAAEISEKIWRSFIILMRQLLCQFDHLKINCQIWKLQCTYITVQIKFNYFISRGILSYKMYCKNSYLNCDKPNTVLIGFTIFNSNLVTFAMFSSQENKIIKSVIILKLCITKFSVFVT